MPFALILFAISVLLLLLLLVGYPALVFVLSKIYSRKVCKRDYFPKSTIIIPCYNERDVIKHKIENTFSLSFPPNQLEVIIVDSASNDGTYEILKELSAKYPYKILREPLRKGKASAINAALKQASGDIVLLSDADSLLRDDAINKIVRNFADSSVGAVVARYEMKGKSTLSKSVSVLFSFFREKVRHFESIIDSSSYFTGEFLAFRRDLIESIDEDAIADDMFILFEIRRKGYRCVTDPDSVVSEYLPIQASGTLEHRRRTMHGILHVSAKYKDLLFRRKYGFFGCLIFPVSSARIILLPFACLFGEISFLYLLFSTNPSIFLFALLAFVIFSLFLGAIKKEVLFAVFSVPILQVAMILGTIDFIRGDSKHNVWSKNKKSLN